MYRIIVHIGTHDLSAMVGYGGDDTQIVGWVCQKKPEGFKEGVVVNLEKASNTLEKVFQQLRNLDVIKSLKGFQSFPIQVVLGNQHLKSFTFSSSQYFHLYRKNISEQDIHSVIQQTRSVATLPLTECVLQCVPVGFIVNDVSGVQDPLGLEAKRLGVTLKIFTMAYDSFKNISRAFELAEIDADGYYPRTMASSLAVLNQQEKDQGALLVDIDYDVTYLSYWNKGELVQTHVLDCGDKFLTQKVAEHWKLKEMDAERVKARYGSFDTQVSYGEELIPLIRRDSTEDCPVKHRDFHAAFLNHAQEWGGIVLKEIQDFLKRERIYHPQFVLTGSGVKYDGFLEFLHEKFSVTARLGQSKQIDAPHEVIVDPAMTPLIGLMNWLCDEEVNLPIDQTSSGFFANTVTKAKNWFVTYF